MQVIVEFNNGERQVFDEPNPIKAIKLQGELVKKYKNNQEVTSIIYKG